MGATEIRKELDAEIEYASHKYGSFTSAAEGMGVLLEEFHELREAVRANDSNAIINEAVQVSAVAFRLACSMGHPETLKRSGCK